MTIQAQYIDKKNETQLVFQILLNLSEKGFKNLSVQN